MSTPRRSPRKIANASPMRPDGSFHDPIDPTVSFLYAPHSILVLIIALATLLHFALTSQGSEQGLLYKSVQNQQLDSASNVKMGIYAATIFFVLIGVVTFKNGPFIRPHPAVWRGVMGLTVAYQTFLVWLVFQNKTDARKILSYIDPTLGVPPPEQSYGENCALTIPNIKNQIFDIFVLAHTFGWIAKYLIFRDTWLAWTMSIAFEIMEYSLQHQLPNFEECWWDHWILDVLVCNWLGIWMGQKICHWLEIKEYKWNGVNEIKGYKGKIRRTLGQFTPHSWTKYEWEANKSFKRFVAVGFLIVISLMAELNSFYLKYLLWIPAPHWINLYHLILMFLVTIPGCRELYQYISDPECKRLGMYAWMNIANVMTESIICYKFSKGEFNVPAPAHVWYFWSGAGVILVIHCCYFYIYKPYMQRMVEKEE